MAINESLREIQGFSFDVLNLCHVLLLHGVALIEFFAVFSFLLAGQRLQLIFLSQFGDVLVIGSQLAVAGLHGFEQLRWQI